MDSDAVVKNGQINENVCRRWLIHTREIKLHYGIIEIISAGHHVGVERNMRNDSFICVHD